MKEYLDKNKERVDKYFSKILPNYKNKTSQAMSYAVLNGGKRLRPTLVYATGEIFNTPYEHLDVAAASVELIHCYSLIHDDLPAMDNDDLRRGKPTCHKQFDEATAILAGDALQTLAFEILSQDELNPASDQNKVRMIKTLANATGINGMVLGQSQDIEAENKIGEIDLDILQNIHENKTGKLITASIHLGILASNCNDFNIIKSLLKFGNKIGTLFQIQDDILDETSSTELLGKPSGSDTKNNKATYISLLGLTGAKQSANKMLNEALTIINNLKQNYKEKNFDNIENIAKYFLARIK